MTGPRAAERRWTPEEENQLRHMRAAGKTAIEIARKLKRTPGAVYARLKSISAHRPMADAQ
jgi:DNA-binding CsgD family transcriptional regulator